MVKKKRLVFFLVATVIFGGGGFGQAGALEQVGSGELKRLVAQHLPQPYPDEIKSLDVLHREIDLGEGRGKVHFSIPGFKTFACGKCHQGPELLASAAMRMKEVLTRLQSQFPDISRVPLKQYIIQPWADELLSPRQFAHTTFDSIRIFPRTILIDSKIYGNATHLHETLHLTQEFVGPANELEAYGLNIRSDPRFLLLNYPYFSDVVTAFFLADFQRILKDFYARPVDESSNVSRETQWFMDPFDEKDLKSLAQAVNAMEPVLAEVTRLLRKDPIPASYWSEQTNDGALLLEIAAVKLLPLPPVPEITEAVRLEAYAIIDHQMRKTDNTRLGYKVNRKQEALLTLKHQLRLDDPLARLSLYFRYLKGRFIGPGGEVRLTVENKDDLTDFAEQKLEGIARMSRFERLTPLEKDGANLMIESIKQKLQDL
ncbi:MAG: hypothetical protein NPINA01_21440 [Nitrospinaceae bacterium]|nr:MAG: hypothetical protein NPINA01_21440 [Nitrospinaceae bacterium]